VKTKKKLPVLKQMLLWLTKPIRLYVAYRFKLAITKDIALAEAHWRLKKPHWSEKMVKKRARAKYVAQLKIIGAA
jgi:hypothetical protein